MPRAFLVTALVVSGIAVGLAFAQEAATGPRKQGNAANRQREAEEKAIRGTAESFVVAFNAADAKAVAAQWTADGEYVDEMGNVLHGRDAIEKQYAALFAGRGGLKMDIGIDSIRFVSPQVAIEDGMATVLSASSEPLSISRYTAMHVRQDGKWLLASVRDTQSVALSNSQHLNELEWLIGSWVAPTNTGSLHSTCEWILNRNFIKRTHRASEAGRVISTGIQMIGWDPATGEIWSWSIDSEGGHGNGIWSRDGNHWVVESTGVEPNGSTSSAVNVITEHSEDGFIWQSIDRTVDGELLPAVDAIEVKRVKPDK